LDTSNAEETGSEHYYGSDGFGDTYTDDIDINELQEEHAAYALYKITSKNPGVFLYDNIIDA
jgi:hypothetical protein